MPSLTELLAGGTKLLQPKGGCHTCPRKRKDFVPATLRPARVIWLGEAPGQVETETGEGFTGKSGQMLRNQAESVGIEEPFACTNSIHCRPPKNRDPTKKELSCCFNQFVLSEIAEYEFVVMVGNTPMTNLFPGTRGKKLRGNLAYHPDFPKTRFYGMLHPAAIFRNPAWRDQWEKEMARLSRILKGDTEAKHTIVTDTPDFLAQLEAALDSSAKLSFDLETSRHKSWEPEGQIRCMACTSDGQTAFFVRADQPIWDDACDLIVQKMLRLDTQIIGHVLGFDLPYFEKERGFYARARTIIDTQVLYYLYKGRKQAGLKELVSQELDGYRHLVYNPSTETDMGILAKYNTEDVVHPYQLVTQALPRLRSRTLDLMLRVTGPSSHALGRVTQVGVHFDVEVWAKKKEQLVGRRKEILAKWKADDPEFTLPDNFGDKDLAQYIFQTKKLPVERTTPKGSPAVDAEAVQLWISRSNAAYLSNLLDKREVDKDLSTYVKPYSGLIAADGRVHPNYNNTKTRTGRTSSNNPNWQNLRRGPTIRNFFIPTPGWIMCQGDYNQIELRISFSLARDPVGIKAYKNGGDAHLETGKIIAGFRGSDKVTKDDRTGAKPVNFALIYGGAWTTLQDYARKEYGFEFSEEQSKDFVRGFFEKYTRLEPWHRESLLDFRKHRGWVESVVGHVSYWYEWDDPDYKVKSHAERSALNSRVQGPAAAMKLYALVLADRMFAEADMESRLLGEIHDSLVWESPEDECEAAEEVVCKAVNQVYSWTKHWMKVPLVMDFERGPALGSLESSGSHSAG